VLLKAVNAARFIAASASAARWSPGKGALSPSELRTLLAYIRAGPNLEVILTARSFYFKPRRIRQITQALGDTGHVKIMRWHSRVPVVEPENVTNELAAALIAPAYVGWRSTPTIPAN